MKDVPQALEKLQSDFGAAMRTPFEFHGSGWRTRSEEYSEWLMTEISAQEEQGMSPADRMSVYNQQYWFRLLTVMQEEYPVLESLLGIDEFNQLVMRYLDKNPSRSTSLRDLSTSFRDFLKEEELAPKYQECAELEWAFIVAFDAAELPVLDLSTMDETRRAQVMESRLDFQPHMSFFRETWNLVEYRRQVLSKNEAHLEQSEGYWAILRSARGVVASEIGPLQYQLLRELQDRSFMDAVAEVADSCSEAQMSFLGENLQNWFAHWSQLGWFSQSS